MTEKTEATFQVNPYNDPILVKIVGRACFSNSAPLKSFFRQMAGQGKRHFIVDFDRCSSMDSTFLGILAGTAMELRRAQPHGRLILARLGSRNLELVRNLGLHRILVVDDSAESLSIDEAGEVLEGEAAAERSEVENARLVLQAHEDLVQVDESNRTKFQDVISFLRNQIDDTPSAES
jgi:anti-sigma B factor antagonist